jgi:hypothetical protein
MPYMPMGVDPAYNVLAMQHNALVAGGCGPGGCGPVGCAPTQSNFCACCPLDPVVQTASQHQFQSQCPAHENEGMVARHVDYITEAVQVPVQRPIIHERIHRTREIPTEHYVRVQNIPCCGGPVLGSCC